MSEDWGSHFTAEEVNSPDFGLAFAPNPEYTVPIPGQWSELVSARSAELARDRDAYARRLLEDRLPRPLHFLIDRPKALKRVLRVVKRWKPTMTKVDFRQRREGQHHTIQSFMSAEAAEEAGRAWLAEMNARGMAVLGPIFTYTDPSGLPAEVYGGE